MPEVDRRVRVAVAGAGICGSDLADVAEEVGRRVARADAVLICGGLGGVMEAVARGASNEGGLTVGLLPGRDARAANPYIHVPMPTGLGEGRNLLVARTANVLIAIGGEWGTLSEVAMARKCGVPVVLLRPALAAGLDLPVADDAEEAVSLALHLAAGA